MFWHLHPLSADQDRQTSVSAAVYESYGIQRGSHARTWLDQKAVVNLWVAEE